MPPIVQAKCPGCKNVLRIPADWAHRPVQCKHCGTVIQARLKPSPPPNSDPKLQTPLPSSRAAKPPHSSRWSRHDQSAASAGSEAVSPESAEPGPIVRPPVRRRPRASWSSMLSLLCTLALAAGFAVLVGPRLVGWGQEWRDRLLGLQGLAPASVDDRSEASQSAPKVTYPDKAVFPRRALVIWVSNYLYANPVGASPGQGSGASVRDLTQKLARGLHIPLSQIVELSDAAPPTRARGAGPAKADAVVRPPLKPLLQDVLRRFLAASRPQDRVLLVFIGHAVEIDDEAYLVPLEGELTVKETLVPLKWVYDQLAACPARQKVLVLDVCRQDVTRGQERPATGPMGPQLAAALQAPPPGVQVWSACAVGQYSYEFDGTGVFLDQLVRALGPQVLKGIQQPTHSLPLAALAEAVGRATAAEVQAQFKAAQTPQVSGEEPAEGASYDPNEPLPPPLPIDWPPPATPDAAPPELVRAILREVELPPIRLQPGPAGVDPLETLLPFSARRLQEYLPDYSSLEELKDPARFPLRCAVLNALAAIRKAVADSGLQLYCPRGGSERIKSEVLENQQKPARIRLELTEALENLLKAGEHRAAEPSKRWQAHYDFVHAQLLARIAFFDEYNLMRGKIRRDELPELDPDHSGWKLASRDKLSSGREVREMANESKRLLAKLARDHAGTPWEVLAKREQLTALGLEWQPSR